ncbi:MAG: hypothetical protein JKY15_04065 [Deltaproteobacteria bacterium]|nr:hypothetical protein [Deltaproteobacteria bacterium]
MSHPEHDVSSRANLMIWGGFFLFALVLYVAITGLSIYFRTAAEWEYDVKIGEVKSRELIELQQKEAEMLKGIDEAMGKVVREAH